MKRYWVIDKLEKDVPVTTDTTRDTTSDTNGPMSPRPSGHPVPSSAPPHAHGGSPDPAGAGGGDVGAGDHGSPLPSFLTRYAPDDPLYKAYGDAGEGDPSVAPKPQGRNQPPEGSAHTATRWSHSHGSSSHGSHPHGSHAGMPPLAAPPPLGRDANHRPRHRREEDPGDARGKAGGKKSHGVSTAAPLTDTQFAWMQEYFARSDQFVFSISRFSIFWFASMLLLLGALFFVAGFMAAFWLMAYSNVLTENMFTRQASELTQQQRTLADQKSLILQETSTIKELAKDIKGIKASSQKAPSKSPVQDQALLAAERRIEDLEVAINTKLDRELAQGRGRTVGTTINTPVAVVRDNAQTFDRQLGLYTVTTATTRVPAEAIMKAEALQKKGYEPYVVRREDPGMGVQYLVKVGAYDNNQFAQQVVEHMAETLGDKRVELSLGILKSKSDRIIYPPS